MFVSQLMTASESQLSCLRRRHCLALKKGGCLSACVRAQFRWHCPRRPPVPGDTALRGVPDSATSCALHVQVLTQKSMSPGRHELLLESNCFINYCLFSFKILINNLSACLGLARRLIQQQSSAQAGKTGKCDKCITVVHNMQHNYQ